jgi:hypothetical protein
MRAHLASAADRFRQRCRVRFSKRAAQLIQFVGDIIFNPRTFAPA